MLYKGVIELYGQGMTKMCILVRVQHLTNTIHIIY